MIFSIYEASGIGESEPIRHDLYYTEPSANAFYQFRRR